MTETSKTPVVPKRETIKKGDLSNARIEKVTKQVKVIKTDSEGNKTESIEDAVDEPLDYEVIHADGTLKSHASKALAEEALNEMEMQAQATIDLRAKGAKRSTVGGRGGGG